MTRTIAAILLITMSAQDTKVEEGYTSLFNGKDLTGWQYGKKGAGENKSGAGYQVDTSWHAVGVGDFNGDGRDDILWRNDNGTVTDWLGQADGRFTGNTDDANLKVGAGWQVTGIGDYNGDGRDDVLWSNQNGDHVQWLGQADGGFASNATDPLGSLPVDWQVQTPDLDWM